ncbi:MAG: DUF885 domain-containing protein [Firmicutes bacterium]|nr:DUF885 domain-containing protein [Bacillota bacterium]
MPEKTANETVKDLGRKYLDFILEFFPSAGTMMGLYHLDDVLDTINRDKIEQLVKQTKSMKEEAEAVDINELGVSDSIDLRLLKSELHKTLRSFEVEKDYASEPSFYPEVCFNAVYGILFRHQDKLKEKAGALLSRLRGIPEFLSEGKKLLETPPRLFVENAIESAESGKVLFEESLEELFSGELSTYKNEYEDLKIKALDALEDYKKFLKEELLEKASPDFAVGREMFEDRLKNDYFLTESADEIEALGKELFEVTEKELIKLAAEIDPSKKWVDLVKENKIKHPEPDKMIEAYNETVAKIKQFIIDRDLVSFPPGEKMEIIFTPPFERHLIPWAAFFPCAHFDKTSAGHFVVTPPNPEFPPEKQALQMQEHNYNKMILNAVHEAYPGHHLQLCHARENPSIIRGLAGCNLFVEGWALYTEELMQEIGYLTEPMQILFQLKDKVWRASRIIIDVGLHVKGMPMEEAMNILTRTIGYSEHAALTEVKRYCRTPTQPLSYLTGLTKIQQMKKAFMSKYPESGLKQFHDKVLACGSIPPALIAEEIGI